MFPQIQVSQKFYFFHIQTFCITHFRKMDYLCMSIPTGKKCTTDIYSDRICHASNDCLKKNSVPQQFTPRHVEIRQDAIWQLPSFQGSPLILEPNAKELISDS